MGHLNHVVDIDKKAVEKPGENLRSQPGENMWIVNTAQQGCGILPDYPQENPQLSTGGGDRDIHTVIPQQSHETAQLRKSYALTHYN